MSPIDTMVKEQPGSRHGYRCTGKQLPADIEHDLRGNLSLGVTAQSVCQYHEATAFLVEYAATVLVVGTVALQRDACQFHQPVLL